MDQLDWWRMVGGLRAAMATMGMHGPGAHGRPGPYGRGGPWGFVAGGRRARRGDVRAAILAMLVEREMNGYQLMQALEERSRGRWRPSPGAVYPALQQLEDEGLIRAESTDASAGRVFRLTAKGERVATAQAKEDAGRNPWDPPEEDAGEDPARLGLARLLPGLCQPVIALAQGGTQAQIREAKKVLKDARRALYRILAEQDDDDDDAGD